MNTCTTPVAFLCTRLLDYMKKTLSLFIISAAFCSNAIAQDAGKKNAAQIQTPAQQLIAGTGEDSLNSYGAGHARTVISGYGEVAYQRDFNAQTSEASLKRAVLFIGHQFTGKIALFSELEVEDAKIEAGGVSGEVSMEQLYLKFAFNPRQYLTAGLILPRIGITNENHMPTNFNGVERPLVEQLVIPTTWREIGVAFYGQSTALPFSYSAAIMNGLNSGNFEHGSGFKGAMAEGQNAPANSLAFTASAQYYTGNWKFQVSGYVGGTTPVRPGAADTLQLQSGFFGSPMYLGEADVQYNNNGLSFKALGSFVALPEAGAINRAFDHNAASQMYGAYAELAYNLLQHAKKTRWQNKQLNIFARYETLDLNAAIPSDGIIDGTLKQNHLIAGVGYYPIPHVVVKADVRLMNTGDINPVLVINPNPNAAPYKTGNTFLNIALGYSF